MPGSDTPWRRHWPTPRALGLRWAAVAVRREPATPAARRATLGLEPCFRYAYALLFHMHDTYFLQRAAMLALQVLY